MRTDSSRLAELRRHLILDSSPERAYDDITQMLSSSMQVPIAMVSLLDDKRDWFKSVLGLPVTESPASTSFCERFFFTTDDIIVVENTANDALFASHPLVVGPPYVRFYAAARLAINGQTLGTLCAYDVRPHQVSGEAIEQLRFLAGNAMSLIRRRV